MKKSLPFCIIALVIACIIAKIVMSVTSKDEATPQSTPVEILTPSVSPVPTIYPVNCTGPIEGCKG